MRHLLRRGRRSLAGWLEPRGAGHHPVPLGMGPVAGMPSRPQPPTGYAGHYCRTARSPAGRRHPRTGARDRAPRRRTRGRPAPAPPARPPSRSPGSPAQPSAHPPSPAAPAPGKSPGPPGRMYGNARSTQRLTSSRNTRPARPVRGRPWKTDGAHRPSWRPDAVRYMSVDSATQGPTARQGDTRRDREETARIAENYQLVGRFRRWWQVLGSNQGRRSRRFYRPPRLRWVFALCPAMTFVSSIHSCVASHACPTRWGSDSETGLSAWESVRSGFHTARPARRAVRE
jgi:hypothetical protein